MELLHAPLPLFIIQAAAIIILSRVLGIGAKKIGQPMVVAEIVAGVLLGPSLLGWVLPGVSKALFPASSLSALGLLSQVGLLLFMFLVGLELDPKLLQGRARTSVAISYTSIIFPFALGVLLAFRLDEYKPEGVSKTPFVLFMGAAMSITAFPVLARILVERRLLRTTVGATAIACAAVDDVSAWCMLAVVVSITRAASAWRSITTIGLALAYILFMLLVVRPLLARLANRNRVGLSQGLVAVVLVFLLASSFITEAIGIHALFGAFLFGAVLPKQGSLAGALAEKIEDVVVVLFLPLFFAFSGLRTHVDLLNNTNTWGICGLIIVFATVGKFGGSFAAGRLTGLSAREAGAVGILMNTRGLVELVLLNIALDLGVITPTLFTMMVVMALVTTFMTTPLMQIVYPIEKLARQLAEAPPSRSLVTDVRYTTVMCIADERTGPSMLSFGAAVVGNKNADSRLYALHLIPPADRASFLLDQQRGDAADPEHDVVLEPILSQAKGMGMPVRPLSFVSAAPADDICAVADVKTADIVVLGWHKPILGDAMLTGVVHGVMVGAGCDVGVLVDRGLKTIRKLLVPYRGTNDDRAALRLAGRIAANTGAELTILHVVAADHTGGDQKTEMQVHEELGDSGEELYKVVFKTLSHAEPTEAALEESRRGYDLVVVGMGRHWGLEHKRFGARAEALLASSPSSLVVVRHGDRRGSSTVPRREAQRARFVSVP